MIGQEGWRSGGKWRQWISDKSQYNRYEADISCVPPNFLNVTDLAFYYPKDVQDDVKVNTTASGRPNAVAMLYSDEQVDEYPTYPGTDTDYYNVTVGAYNGRERFTETIKILIPSGFEDKLSATAGDVIRLQNRDNGYWTYRAEIRGMITKMPGFASFSGYSSAAALLGTPAGLVSNVQYKQMLDDFGSEYSNPDAMANFYNRTSQY